MSTLTPSLFGTPLPTGSGVRLTRRGRLVLFGVPLLTLLLAALISVGAAVSSAGAASSKESAVKTVTVLPGDSLWSVAERANPEVDTREVVDAIVRVNQLEDSSLVSGQQLDVPIFAR